MLIRYKVICNKLLILILIFLLFGNIFALSSIANEKDKTDLKIVSTLDKEDFENNDDFFEVTINNLVTSLEITSTDIPDSVSVHTSSIFTASVKNTGNTTNETISVRMNASVDGEVDTIEKDGLEKNETFDFVFNWTPTTIGIQTISFSAYLNNSLHDTFAKNVMISEDKFEWWNENWHYRQFMVVSGNGNLSMDINFSEYINDLGLCKNSFDDAIRIIEYDVNTNIIGKTQDYFFNESDDYNSTYNAKGTLLWNVDNNLEEKYYCIYFDVQDNAGVRDLLPENYSLIISGDAEITYLGYLNAWWAEIITPINGDYCFINDSINISVKTNAKAKEVSAFCYLTNNANHNFAIKLNNVNNSIEWENNTSFNAEGNWTIMISSVDESCFSPDDIIIEFFVGQPDIEILGLSVATDWQYYSNTIYTNDTVNFSLYVISNYANVQNIAISFLVNNSYIENKTISLDGNENTTVYFDLYVNTPGEFIVKFIADSTNITNETNELNNEFEKTIYVNEWPDLKVNQITLPFNSTNNEERVVIKAKLSNIGPTDSTNFNVSLYIEPSYGSMNYLKKIDAVNININANSSKNISLIWNSAQPGEWLIGVKIEVNDSVKDSNLENNQLVSSEILKVSYQTGTIPNIKNVNIYPLNQQQGGIVTINAEITGDTRFESVIIDITNPNGVLHNNNSMIRKIDNTFKYEFDKTNLKGKYSFKIIVTDFSNPKNTVYSYGNFTIQEDSIYPIISYYDADPYIQLKNKSVTILCITSDNMMIKTVTATITPPSGEEYIETLDKSSNGKYEYTDIYKSSGKYNYHILVLDDAGNWVKTDEDIFWITTNLNDTDNDGMPNDWELRYNLDPEDPKDAKNDTDSDGYTNLKEYQIGTHPEKDILLQNVAYRIKENSWYLVGSIILFLVILILSRYGKRRKNT